MNNIERRFTSGQVEIRSEGEEKKIRGYASVFNRQSENLGSDKYQFREIIAPGAFDDVLSDDVRALFNHDPSLILARSKGGKGTLQIGTDATGLWYEFTPPDTQAGRDLLVSIERGDVDQSSFGFEISSEGEKFERTSDGENKYTLRTITKVKRLHDVSPVTYPAYPDATVALRSLEQFYQSESSETDNNEPPLELWERRLRIISLTPA